MTNFQANLNVSDPWSPSPINELDYLNSFQFSYVLCVSECFIRKYCVKLFSQDHSNKVKGETFSLLAQVCKPEILCGHLLIWSNFMMIFKLRSLIIFVFKSSLMWDCFQASLSKVHFSLFHCNRWCCKMCLCLHSQWRLDAWGPWRVYRTYSAVSQAIFTQIPTKFWTIESVEGVSAYSWVFLIKKNFSAK